MIEDQVWCASFVRSEDVEFFETFRLDHLLIKTRKSANCALFKEQDASLFYLRLPWDGNGSRVEFGVE